LVEIGSVVSEEKIFLISSPLFSNLHNQSKSVKVQSSEKIKHNDELFNIYYGIFMHFELLPILTDYAN
jgi:hypothetical protein